MYSLVIIKAVVLVRHEIKFMHQYGCYTVHRSVEAEPHQNLIIPRKSTRFHKEAALQHLTDRLKTWIRLKVIF
jgi:hypothetical protein